MTRPNQHPQVEKLLKIDAVTAGIWKSISRCILAPPNLQFAAAILHRLAKLISLVDHFGSLPSVLEQRDDPTTLLNFLRSHTEGLDPGTAAALFKAPGRGDAKQLSPMNGYCLIDYPTWCALALSSTGDASSAFDRVAATAVGEVMRYTAEHLDEKSYREFLTAWQARREQEKRTDVRRVDHPLGGRIDVIAKIERLLRQLSTPEHHDAWLTFIATKPDEQDNPLDHPESWAAAHTKTRETLASLNATIEKMEAELGRRGRRLARIRRNPHFLSYGPGCYTRGLDWLIHQPVATTDQPVNTSIDILRADAQRLLSEDYPVEELSIPSGLEIYAPDEEASRLATSALEIRTAWQHHVQQWNNQILAWSRGAMSIPQLVVFCQAMFPSGENRDNLSDVSLEYRLMRCAAFNTGLSIASLRSELLIAKGDPKYLRSRVEYLWERRLFRIATNLPVLVGYQSEAGSDASRQIRNFIHIPDRIGFHHYGQIWLDRHGDDQVLVSLRLSSEARCAARDATASALSAAGLTDTVIHQALPRAVHARSDDFASVALWGDWQPAHVRTLRHYLSPSADVVERPIDAALIKLIKDAKARQTALLLPYVDPPRHIDGRRIIGAPDLPIEEDLAALIADFSDRLAEDPDDSIDALRRYHDSYTAWMTFFQAAALGYRDAIDPSPEFIRIGGRVFAVFSDKDSGGFHRRIVPVPELFMRQQCYFDEHRRFIGSIATLDVKASAAWMLALSGGKPTDFRPSHARKEAAGVWKYRVNALRRRMRTRLLERGAPGEPSDIWMGHWFVGNCPWMEGSGFVMDDLTRLVDEHITPILIEDGWRPIRSRLTEGLPWATT